MVSKNNILILCLITLLHGCAWAGYFDSEDIQTVLSQGFSLEKARRYGPAEERYLKGLRLAQESGDQRMIAHAKSYIGQYYRNPNAYEPNKVIKYLKESLAFYENSDKVAPGGNIRDYTALMEVYGKEGNKTSACSYLRKAKDSYVKEVVLSPKYAPNGEGYKHFFNPVRRQHPFRKFDELIDYYNQQLGCGL